LSHRHAPSSSRGVPFYVCDLVMSVKHYPVQLTRPRNTALMLFRRLSAWRRRSCGTCREALKLANERRSCLRLSMCILLLILWSSIQLVSVPSRQADYKLHADGLSWFESSGRGERRELSTIWRAGRRCLLKKAGPETSPHRLGTVHRRQLSHRCNPLENYKKNTMTRYFKLTNPYVPISYLNMSCWRYRERVQPFR